MYVVQLYRSYFKSPIIRYDESRKSSFEFTEKDMRGFVDREKYDIARLLLDSVSKVLGVPDKPSLADNFFEIGGDSVNMVQVKL